MSPFFGRRRKGDEPPTRTAAQDADVARLTAKADLIMNELGGVVGQMAEMLRDAQGTGEP